MPVCNVGTAEALFGVTAQELESVRAVIYRGVMSQDMPQILE